jgi:predicted N-acetyltransferase YhbS
MLTIETEGPGDGRAREMLLDRCFGARRHRRTVARLRRGRRPAEGLALLARLDGVVVGSVRLWDIAAGGAGAALLLGPIAVAPEHRRTGVGAALMREALARAERLGHRAVLLVGDAAYYARFGFRPDLTPGLDLPGPVERDRFLGLELVPGALRDATGPVLATGRLAFATEGPRRRRAA